MQFYKDFGLIVQWHDGNNNNVEREQKVCEQLQTNLEKARLRLCF